MKTLYKLDEILEVKLKSEVLQSMRYECAMVIGLRTNLIYFPTELSNCIEASKGSCRCNLFRHQLYDISSE